MNACDEHTRNVLPYLDNELRGRNCRTSSPILQAVQFAESSLRRSGSSRIFYIDPGT
jgi:hypothetical protein